MKENNKEDTIMNEQEASDNIYEFSNQLPQSDYSLSATSVEFSQFKLPSENNFYNQQINIPENNYSSLFASAHVDGSVKVYKFNNFSELQNKHEQNRPDLQFKDHFHSTNQAIFPENTRDFDGNTLNPAGIGGYQPWLLTCSDDTLIHLYDLEKAQLARSFIGNKGFVTHIKFNKEASMVLSASADHIMSLWDVRSNKSIFRLLAHPEPITSIDINRDSTLISSSSSDCYVRLWDIMKGQCLKTMMADAGSKNPISFCRMNPTTSQYLLFGSMNSTMGLYNYQNDLLKSYRGHRNQFYNIDAKFVKNEKTNKYLILSGSEDGYLYGWDLNSQRLQIKIPLDQSIKQKQQIKSDHSGIEKEEQELAEASQQTIMNLDYHDGSGTLALCGNFGELKLIQAKGGLQGLIDETLNQKNTI